MNLHSYGPHLTLVVPVVGEPVRSKLQTFVTDSAEVLPLAVAIDAYRTSLEGVGTSTFNAKFKYDLPYFVAHLEHVEKIRNPILRDVTRGAIEAFVDYRLNLESPKTVERRLATIKTFCAWAAENCRTFIDPSRHITAPRVDRRIPERLSDAQLEMFLRSAEEAETGFLKARNRALLWVLAETGLRCNEARLLTAGNLNAELSKILNIKGKGRHYRDAFLTARAKEALTLWLPERSERLKEIRYGWATMPKDRQLQFPLFVSGEVRGNAPAEFRMSPKTIWNLVEKTGQRAGIEGCHPHLLRHTFAHRLLEATGNLAIVQKALGHVAITTTQIYVNPTEDEMKRGISLI